MRRLYDFISGLSSGERALECGHTAESDDCCPGASHLSAGSFITRSRSRRREQSSGHYQCIGIRQQLAPLHTTSGDHSVGGLMPVQTTNTAGVVANQRTLVSQARKTRHNTRTTGYGSMADYSTRDDGTRGEHSGSEPATHEGGDMLRPNRRRVVDPLANRYGCRCGEERGPMPRDNTVPRSSR
jgi:hypothetical protein